MYVSKLVSYFITAVFTYNVNENMLYNFIN